MTRLLRPLLPAALLLGLALAAPPPAVLAQEENAESTDNAEGGTSKGDPLYGYIGTGLLAAVAIFAVCKSARR